MKKPLMRNEKGLTLIELIVAMAIMTLLSLMVTEVTVVTMRSMINSTDIGVANGNAKEIMNQMTNDLRQAGQAMTTPTRPIFSTLSSSAETRLCITLYGVNLDGMVPGGTDDQDDVVCYYYTPPSGSDPSATNYVPGYIDRAQGSGGGAPPAALRARMSSPLTDIVSMSVDYCRPSGTVPGTYTCSSTVDTSNSLLTNASCVFQIRITMQVRRTARTAADASLIGELAPVTLKTTVEPRNVVFAALHQDSDRDGTYIDCCDPDQATLATWCPPPQE